jgi:hypothetical protein
MSRNQLDQETSPYLLQHAENPVHWRAWTPTALAEARDQGKPILLSVGYAACHWCHVMAHESFENRQTAEVMNSLFIPIKVDREERPDLDAIYQAALANLGQSGGWPLTMFLTPDGAPFWGGTYFPSEPRYGRPSFRDVLTGVADAFANAPDKIAGNVTALRQALQDLARTTPGALPDVARLDLAAATLLRAVDPRHGGLTGAPKFPQTPLFQLMWRAGLRRNDSTLLTAVRTTAVAMCQGGIYDHLGGGFARYSTDETWLVPHFEKMLYDNAQMIELLTAVWQHDHSPLLANRVAETVTWILEDMMAEHGAFAATMDADSDGEEGKFYVWSAKEIDRLLTPGQASLIKTLYAVTPGGNWEGQSILHRNHSQGDPDDTLATAIAEAKSRLLAARNKRVHPARDDKILADWNGMMIAALAHAGFAFDRSDWLSVAQGAFAALCRHQQRDNRLCHAQRQGRRLDQAMLDDYAQMARAALILFELTGRADYLQQAERWVSVLDRHYWDQTDGGYFFTADDAKDLIVRTKSASDNATPSGNGVMVEVLARLYYQTGQVAYLDRLEALVRAFSGQMDRSFPGLAALLNGWDLASNAVQLVLVCGPDDPLLDAFLAVVRTICLPTLVMTRLSPGAILPPGHPAAGKIAGTQSRAFVCRGPVCSLPLTDANALQRVLIEGLS